MISASWMDFWGTAVGLYGLLAAALALLTARQRWSRRRERRRERCAEAWMAERLASAGPAAVASRPEKVRITADEVLSQAEALVSRFEVIDFAARTGGGEELARELRRVLLPVLEDGMTRLESPFARGVRKRLIRCLRLLSFAPSAEMLPALLGASTLGDPALAVEALHALGHGSRHYEAAVTPLAFLCRDARRHGGESAVFLASTWALARVLTDHPRNAPMLAADPSISVRRLAVRAAASAEKGRPASAVEMSAVVERATRDADATVRATALRALLSRRSSHELPDLFRLALEDPDEGVRLAGVDGGTELWEKGQDSRDPRVICEIVALLSRSLTEASPRLASAIARSLGRLAPEETTLPLAELIRDAGSRPWPRNRASFEALGYLARPETARALLPGLADPQPELRHQIARTVAALARTVYPEELGEEVTERLLARLAEETSPQSLAALLEAVTFTADRRAVPHLMARIPHVPNALRERIVEAIATLGRIRPAKTPRGLGS